jgi:hypothetical protein
MKVNNVMKWVNANVRILVSIISLNAGCIVIPIGKKHAVDWEVVAARADGGGEIVEQFVRREEGVVLLGLGFVCEPVTVEHFNRLDHITADSIDSFPLFCGVSWEDHFIPIPNTDAWLIYRFGNSHYEWTGDMTVRIYSWSKGTIAKQTIKDVRACRMCTDYTFAIFETHTGNISMNLASGETSRSNFKWNQVETIGFEKLREAQRILCAEPILRKY